MKKLWLLIMASLLFTACGATKMIPTGESAEVKLKEGDAAVAKWGSGGFYEGKILKIDGSKYTMAWEDNSNPTTIDQTDVYPVPKAGAKPDAKVGDMVLVKAGSGSNYWEGAELTSIEGDVYKVKKVSATTTTNVPPEKIIKVSSATASDFKERAGSTGFLQEAQKSKPTVPAGYKPKKGDKVLAEWSSNSWFPGTVDNITGSNVYIAWGGNLKPSAVSEEKIIPQPTASDKQMPTEKQFLLVRMSNSLYWQYAQTVSVNGSSVEAKLSTNETKTFKPGEFVLLN